MSGKRTHGARSQRELNRRAGYLQQSACKPLGLARRDLDPSTRYVLTQWSRAAATVYLLDEWVSEHGLVDETGAPPAFTAGHHAARNSALRLWRVLEPRLLEAAATKEGDPIARLIAEGRAVREAREEREGMEPDV